MTRARLLSGSLLALAVLPASAHAAWSPAATIPGTAGASQPVLAVDGRGDVALASTAGTRTTTDVRVAVRRAGTATFSRRTVFHVGNTLIRGLTLTMDRRGRVTVAWIDQPRRGGHRTVRAVWRSASGRWSDVQSIGRSSSFLYALPRLVAAPDGTVVLTYNAGVRAAPGVGAAWRDASGRFGALQAVAGRKVLMEPVLRADAAGRILLAGTRDCDRSSSAGVVHTATARGRRFGTARIVAPAPARRMQLVLDGHGTPVASWLSGMCSTTEDLAGTPRAAVLRGTSPTAPVRLDAAAGINLVLAGAARGAEASWTTYPADRPGPLLLAARIAADGSAAPAAPPADAWVPVASDGAGDQLVRKADSLDTAVDALGARAAGATAITAAPFSAVGFPWTATGAGAGDGRALAAFAPSDVGASRPSLRVAVWRP